MPTVDTPRITAAGTYPRITVNVVTGSGVTDHGALTGLEDDDHPQYAKVDDIPDISGLVSTSAPVVYWAATEEEADEFPPGTVVLLVPVDEGDTTPPSVPGNLAATPGDGEVVLTWDASTDDVAVTGYRVYMDGAETATAATPGATVGDLDNGTEYIFEVTAFDAEGNESERSDPVVATPETPPAGPVLVQAKSLGPTTSVAFRTVTLDAAPTPGNLLVAYVATSTANTTMSHAGWTQAAIASYGSSNQGRCAIWWKVAEVGELAAQTWNFSPSAAHSGLTIEEWSGLDPSPLEGAVAAGSGAATNATSLAIGSVGPVSQPDVLAVACVTAAGGLTLSGWTSGFAATPQSTTQRLMTAHLVSDTPGASISTTATWTPNTFAAGAVAVFKVA